jgi:phage terminase large subunit-like protein
MAGVKTGPDPTPTAVLEKRGSWRAKARRKAAAPKEPPPPKCDRRAKRFNKPEVDKAIRCLPGYDPFVGADDYEFDYKAARAAVGWIERLTHVKGELARTPFLLEPWQRGAVANLFGWKHRQTGYRRYRSALLYVPRKNGKTPMAAALLLYLLFEGREPGAELYGAAATYEQACHVFAHARGMVAQSEALKPPACQVFKGQSKAIQLGELTGFATYKVVASESLAAHGWNTFAGVVDELHTQPDGELVDALETSIGARREPLLLYLTTADYEREGSPCNEMHDFAKRVRDDPRIDPTFLPIVYEAPKDADWNDRGVWAACNPNLGVSLSWEYLEAAFRKAKEVPAKENTFRRLHLNQRTEQATRWLPMDAWDACRGDVDADDLAGKPCWAGLDLATVRDLCAFALYFPEDGHRVLPYFWVPADGARLREKRDRVPYLAWVREGLIRETPGNVTDYDRIRADINELRKRFDIRALAIDRWNSTQLQTQLAGDGLDVVQFGQGFKSMTGPSKELERLVVSRQLQHGGHPVLRWMAANVAVETDAADGLKPTKAKSAEKIDGIVALIMGIGEALVRTAAKTNVYEERGLRWL